MNLGWCIPYNSYIFYNKKGVFKLPFFAHKELLHTTKLVVDFVYL